MKAEESEQNNFMIITQWKYFGWVVSLRFQKEEIVNTCLRMLTKAFLETTHRRKLVPTPDIDGDHA